MQSVNANRLDWERIEGDLLRDGYASISTLLGRPECASMRALFEESGIFRSRIVMERHGFGQGEYKYFSYPLPPLVESLRSDLYAGLAPLANRWNELLGRKERYPATQQRFLEMCEASDQSRPTALLLRYRAGDYNCLHEDLYGEIAFPFQVTVFLSEPSAYEGGEFVLVEQRPRRQSRPIVLRPGEGDALVIPNRHRPVRGKNGFYRTTFRHGVSEVRSGERYTLGLIFHDAR